MPAPETLAHNLLKRLNRAVREFELIADGDKIAVGVSGGKDSLVLLDLLTRGVHVAGRYDLVAIHVDGSAAGLPDMKPLLLPWLDALNVPYEIVPLELPPAERLPLNCFRCSWNRRKSLFLAADRHKCNKVALGHHADDVAVTALMNITHKGKLESLPPRLTFFQGHFTLIRPLIYTPEDEIRRYARARGWTVPPALICPRSSTTRRTRYETFLAAFPPRERQQIRANLRRLTTKERVP